MINLILIVPWIVAGAIAYWKMDTWGKKLNSFDPNLYKEITEDKDGAKQKLKDGQEALKKEAEAANQKVQDIEKEIKDGDKDGSDKGVKTELAEAKKDAETLQQKYELIEKADNLWQPVFTFKNMAWTLGIFLGLGIVLHFITKKILEIFFSDKEG